MAAVARHIRAFRRFGQHGHHVEQRVSLARQRGANPVVDRQPALAQSLGIVKRRNRLKKHPHARLAQPAHDRLQAPHDRLGGMQLHKIVYAHAHDCEIVFPDLPKPASAGRGVAGAGAAKAEVPECVPPAQRFRQHRVPMLIGIISRAAALRDGVAQIRHAQLYGSVAAHHSGKERVRGARPAVLRFHKRRQQRFGVTGNARAAHRRFHAQIRVLLRAQNDRIRRKALSGRDGFARRAVKRQRPPFGRLVEAFRLRARRNAHPRGQYFPVAERLIHITALPVGKRRVHRVGKQKRIAVFPAREHAVKHAPDHRRALRLKPALVAARRQRVGMKVPEKFRQIHLLSIPSF